MNLDDGIASVIAHDPGMSNLSPHNDQSDFLIDFSGTRARHLGVGCGTTRNLEFTEIGRGSQLWRLKEASPDAF